MSSDALNTSVQLSRTTVIAFDSLTVSVTVQNPTAHSITVSGSTPCFITFQLRTPTQELLWVDPRSCAAVIQEFTLAAGASQTVKISWSPGVSGGDYEVVGGLSLATEPGLQVPSRPVRLRILPLER